MTATTDRTAVDEPGTDRPWRVAFILVLGTFMASLDATIVAVGVDTLIAEFDASVLQVQWVSTAYLLAVVTAVPAAGWLADRFGIRRCWLVAVGVFVIGSLLCALAWSVLSLVLFRVLQGLGGGLLPPLGQALLTRVAGPQRIGRLLSVVAAVPMLAPVLGPLAGGSILAVADWPWLFFVNVPVGLAAVLLARRHVPAFTPSTPDERFDFAGAALLAPGLAVVVFGLTGVAGEAGVPLPGALSAVAVGASMLVAFVRRGLRVRAPLIDPRLLGTAPVGAATLALVILGASVFGAVLLLPLYLQSGAGMSPWQVGVLLAPQGIGAVLGAVLVNRTIDRLAPRTLVLSGIALVIIGTVVFTQLRHAPPDAMLAGSLLVRGLGTALISAPVLNLVYSTIAPELVPRAATVLSLAGTVGGSLGIALLSVVVQARLDVTGDPTAAFADTFWIAVALCGIGLLAALRLRRPPGGGASAPAGYPVGDRNPTARDVPDAGGSPTTAGGASTEAATPDTDLDERIDRVPAGEDTPPLIDDTPDRPATAEQDGRHTDGEPAADASRRDGTERPLR